MILDMTAVQLTIVSTAPFPDSALLHKLYDAQGTTSQVIVAATRAQKHVPESASSVRVSGRHRHKLYNTLERRRRLERRRSAASDAGVEPPGQLRRRELPAEALAAQMLAKIHLLRTAAMAY